MTRERLALAEKALWKSGLQVPALAAKERPKATGPAAADRPREEPAPAAEAEETASDRAESSSSEPPSAHN